jgi:hypothetical protein
VKFGGASASRWHFLAKERMRSHFQNLDTVLVIVSPWGDEKGRHASARKSSARAL